MKSKKEETKTVISNNVITGVQWDEKAVSAIDKVAQSLLNLTELFRGQNIHIDSLIKVESDKKGEE